MTARGRTAQALLEQSLNGLTIAVVDILHSGSVLTVSSATIPCQTPEEDMELRELDLLIDTFKFRYRSLSFATKAAKRLKKAFESDYKAQEIGPISLGRSRALIAQMTGHRDWEELKASIDPESTDQIDQDLPSTDIFDRRYILCQRLAKLQKLDVPVAHRLVHDAEPTGSKAGLFRLGNDDYLYLMPPDLAQCVDPADAFKAATEGIPEARLYPCYDYLIANAVEGYRHHGISVSTLAPDAGRGVQIMRHERPVLHVWYGIHNIAELDLPVFDLNGYNEVIHPHPLRPDSVSRLTVELAIHEIEIAVDCSSVARKAAASFILGDVLIASLVSGLTVGIAIEAADFEINIDKNNSNMRELADIIADEFSDFEDNEHELPYLEDCRFNEIVPFETLDIVDK